MAAHQPRRQDATARAACLITSTTRQCRARNRRVWGEPPLRGCHSGPACRKKMDKAAPPLSIFFCWTARRPADRASRRRSCLKFVLRRYLEVSDHRRAALVQRCARAVSGRASPRHPGCAQITPRRQRVCASVRNATASAARQLHPSNGRPSPGGEGLGENEEGRFRGPLRSEIFADFGAGEEIRTLDPNLGNGLQGYAPRYPGVRQTTINRVFSVY
jgi:hypothetical protein